MHVKLSKFTEPDPAKERINKIIFRVVGANGKTSDDPPASIVPPAAAATSPLQPDQVRPAPSRPEQYSAMDVGRVRRVGSIRRNNGI